MQGVASVVTLELEPQGEAGTRLKLHHAFEAPLPLERPRQLIDDHWRFVTGNLMMHLAGGAGLVRLDFTDRTPEVRLSIDIDAPPEPVYRALLEPESVDRWFDGKNAGVEPVVGGRYRLNWSYKVDGRDVESGTTRILALEPNRNPFGWVYYMDQLKAELARG